MATLVFLVSALLTFALTTNAFITYNFHQPFHLQSKFRTVKDDAGPAKKSIIVETPYAFSDDLPSAFEMFGNAPWQYRNYISQTRNRN